MVEGIEAIVFRTVGDQCSLWESLLPVEVRRLPEELARVDALSDDPAFFTPFVPFFDPRRALSRWWAGPPRVVWLDRWGEHRSGVV